MKQDDVIEDQAGLDALPGGAIFQDKIGVVWQKLYITLENGIHIEPVPVYSMPFSSILAHSTQVLDFTPLTVLVSDLPITPAKRTYRNVTVPSRIAEDLGLEMGSPGAKIVLGNT